MLTVTTQLSATDPRSRPAKPCRFCGAELKRTFIDLGMSPLCETYPSLSDIERGEVYYPLHVQLCERCLLVQLGEYQPPENIFTEYPYFSSYSDSWLKHAESYCDKMVAELGLTQHSFVIEVASNDGYLLQYFVRRQVPVLGIEPAANVAREAVEKGVPTLVEFFGERVAKDLAAGGRTADLVAGNNVLAQVPDLNDFVAALRVLLKPDGVLTLEFPHLLASGDRDLLEGLVRGRNTAQKVALRARIILGATEGFSNNRFGQTVGRHAPHDSVVASALRAGWRRGVASRRSSPRASQAHRGSAGGSHRERHAAHHTSGCHALEHSHAGARARGE